MKIKFRHLPSNPQTRKQWLEYCGVEKVPENAFLCEVRVSDLYVFCCIPDSYFHYEGSFSDASRSILSVPDIFEQKIEMAIEESSIGETADKKH